MVVWTFKKTDGTEIRAIADDSSDVKFSAGTQYKDAFGIHFSDIRRESGIEIVGPICWQTEGSLAVDEIAEISAKIY